MATTEAVHATSADLLGFGVENQALLFSSATGCNFCSEHEVIRILRGECPLSVVYAVHVICVRLNCAVVFCQHYMTFCLYFEKGVEGPTLNVPYGGSKDTSFCSPLHITFFTATTCLLFTNHAAATTGTRQTGVLYDTVGAMWRGVFGVGGVRKLRCLCHGGNFEARSMRAGPWAHETDPRLAKLYVFTFSYRDSMGTCP